MKLHEAAELGAEEREKIRRTTEEERERFYAKLQMRLNAQQRRTNQQLPAVEADAQQRSARRFARGNGKGEKAPQLRQGRTGKNALNWHKKRTTGRLCVFLCRF